MTTLTPREELLRFRAHLRKIGSGEHTSRGLSREEARDALELMLRGGATPAQIGAFLIAHRIRRPEPQELAGMLDVYRAWGPRLHTEGRAVCLCMPYDGRNRTAPIYPLTALLLAAAGVPVVLAGGDRMPVKYGVTPQELFALLGLPLRGLPIERVQQGLDRHGLALVHQPDHLPFAEVLIPYREELGKRPPVASVELLWTPHQGNHLLVSGFVHPPTEARAWEALRLAGETDVVTVKGLEGGTDLPVSRACVTARVRDGEAERTILHPRDHGCHNAENAWTGEEDWRRAAEAALEGRGDLAGAAIWNAGAYLWFAGASASLEEGLDRARGLLRSGAARARLEVLIAWRRSVLTVPADEAGSAPGCRAGSPDPAAER
jgi:anthranilate phosphoribosyltransferase